MIITCYREYISTFRSYPELFFIDATYKLNDLRMPLYAVVIVDGSGGSEIVCFWIVQSHSKVSVFQDLKTFLSCVKNIL